MSNLHNQEQEDSIDLSKIFRLLLMQSKLIILISLLGLSASVLHYITADKWYRVNSLVQILPNETANFQQEFTQNFTMGGSYTRDVNSIEQLYKSRSNIFNVVSELKLLWEIDGVSFSDREFIEINLIEKNMGQNAQEISLSLTNEGYVIFDKQNGVALKDAMRSLSDLLCDLE